MSWRDKLKWGDESLKTPEHDALVIWLHDNLEAVVKKLNITQEPYRISEPILEYPVTNKNSTILCFMDLKCNLEYVEVIRKDHKIQRQYRLLFEVKPKIESFGETLRQLRSYEIYDRTDRAMGFLSISSKIIVVSPDIRFKKYIESQGFDFINPDDFEKAE